MSEGIKRAQIEVDLLTLTTLQQGLVALKTQADVALATINEQVQSQLAANELVNRRALERADRKARAKNAEPAHGANGAAKAVSP
jgi:hypothetical protein